MGAGIITQHPLLLTNLDVDDIAYCDFDVIALTTPLLAKRAVAWRDRHERPPHNLCKLITTGGVARLDLFCFVTSSVTNGDLLELQVILEVPEGVTGFDGAHRGPPFAAGLTLDSKIFRRFPLSSHNIHIGIDFSVCCDSQLAKEEQPLTQNFYIHYILAIDICQVSSRNSIEFRKMLVFKLWKNRRVFQKMTTAY